MNLLGRGVLSAISVDFQPTQFPTLLSSAIVNVMTGRMYDLATFQPIEPNEFAAGLALRPEAFRTRILQSMILGALMLRPLPIEVADRVAEFARAMSIDDGMLTVAHDFATGQLGLAAVDFDRNGDTANWSPERTVALHASGLADAWATSVHDPALATRWCSLEALGHDTLGRRLWEFSRARTRTAPPPDLPQRRHTTAQIASGVGWNTNGWSALTTVSLVSRTAV
ncbi:MAG: hypothetical protein ABIR68_18780 [Ilumatobacteraceae bacterium]